MPHVRHESPAGQLLQRQNPCLFLPPVGACLQANIGMRPCHMGAKNRLQTSFYNYKIPLPCGGLSWAYAFAPSIQMSRLSISRVLPSRAAPSAVKALVASSAGVGRSKSL